MELGIPPSFFSEMYEPHDQIPSFGLIPWYLGWGGGEQNVTTASRLLSI